MPKVIHSCCRLVATHALVVVAAVAASCVVDVVAAITLLVGGIVFEIVGRVVVLLPLV